MKTRDDTDTAYASIFIGIMSRVNAPEDLVMAYPDLKQLASRIRAANLASADQEPNAGQGNLPQSSSARPLGGQGEAGRLIKLKDRVNLKAGGQEVVAEVVDASENGRNLMLSFDATLFGIKDRMAVVQGDDGQWTTVFGRQPVELE